MSKYPQEMVDFILSQHRQDVSYRDITAICARTWGYPNLSVQAVGMIAGSNGALAEDRPVKRRRANHVPKPRAAAWPQERVDAMIRLRKEGYSASQIARELGLANRNMVLGKLYRLGMCEKGGKTRRLDLRRIGEVSNA